MTQKNLSRAVVPRLAALAARVLVTGILAINRWPRRQATVFGRPDYEENSLVTALKLTTKYRGRVALLCDSPDKARKYLEHLASLVGGDPAKISLKTRTPISALSAFAWSELLFTTQPLYVSPAVFGRRIHVNLWHGNGPKNPASTNRFKIRIGAQLTAGNSKAWGRGLIRTFGDPAKQELVTGNPRQDLLTLRPRSRHKVRQLGLDPDKPIVLWMPTFRTSKHTGIGTMYDSKPFLASQEEAADGDHRVHASKLLTIASHYGVQLVAKPHPLESESFESAGFAIVSTDEVWEAGLSLYEFIGLADGLISDYSSVWVDFLQTSKPLALYCPDYDSYASNRGFHDPQLKDVASGIFINTLNDFEEYFSVVAAGTSFRPAQLQACLEGIGHISANNKADLLLQDVRDYATKNYGGYTFGI